MRNILMMAGLGTVLFLGACSSKDAASGDKPHATVLLKDGTRMTGSVTASSASEITLAGDDNAPHTLAMNQVRSIIYDDAPAAAKE